MLELLLKPTTVEAKPIYAKTWKRLQTFGSVQMMYAASVYNSKCYIFGGRIYPGSTSRKLSYVFDGTTVTPIADLPKTLFNHRAITVGNKILIFGGVSSLTNGAENMTMYWYDPVTNTYSTDGTIPVSMISFGAALHGDFIYAYGGNLAGGGAINSNTQQFYRYSLTNKTWEKLPFHNGTDVFSCNLFVYKDKLYTNGGITNSAVTTFDNTIRVYDPVSMTWSINTPINTGPTPRSMDGFQISNGVYIYGGRTGASGGTTSCWYYNIDAMTWIQAKNSIDPTAYSLIVQLGDRIFTFDGWISSPSSTSSGIFELS